MSQRSAKRAGRALRRALLVAAAAMLSVSCAHRPVSSSTATEPAVAACHDALAAAEVAAGEGLDTARIRLLNWNVQKKHSAEWRRDFDTLTANADLVLMQEASLDNLDDETFAAGRYRTFAPGYRRAGVVTGVLTLSRSAPLVRCSFVSTEPWLRSPKATSVSAYALAGRDELLAVVNLHALNFSLGLGGYQAQFARIHEVLRDHRGPVILAGDFNTWRGKRMDIVAALASSLDLHPVRFEVDERRRFLGFALDHIYVRGLELRHADTDVVLTSDHNPMKAVLGMSFASP